MVRAAGAPSSLLLSSTAVSGRVRQCSCSYTIRAQRRHSSLWLISVHQTARKRSSNCTGGITAKAGGGRTDVFKPTPHSGYHFDGSARRFFEGWYFKVGCTCFIANAAAKSGVMLSAVATCAMQVTLPGEGQSFAWMYSIEDPGGLGSISGAGAQVVPHTSTALLKLQTC